MDQEQRLLMGWADRHITLLKVGKTVSFRPKGNSMLPRIKSGQLVTVQPVFQDALSQIREDCPKPGDIVLCEVGRAQYLHFVTAVENNLDQASMSRRYRISNAHGRINGWTTKVYGIVTAVED
jgi:hypothetical protein